MSHAGQYEKLLPSKPSTAQRWAMIGFDKFSTVAILRRLDGGKTCGTGNCSADDIEDYEHQAVAGCCNKNPDSYCSSASVEENAPRQQSDCQALPGCIYVLPCAWILDLGLRPIGYAGGYAAGSLKDRFCKSETETNHSSGIFGSTESDARPAPATQKM